MCPVLNAAPDVWIVCATAVAPFPNPAMVATDNAVPAPDIGVTCDHAITAAPDRILRARNPVAFDGYCTDAVSRYIPSHGAVHCPSAAIIAHASLFNVGATLFGIAVQVLFATDNAFDDWIVAAGGPYASATPPITNGAPPCQINQHAVPGRGGVMYRTPAIVDPCNVTVHVPPASTLITAACRNCI